MALQTPLSITFFANEGEMEKLHTVQVNTLIRRPLQVGTSPKASFLMVSCAWDCIEPIRPHSSGRGRQQIIVPISFHRRRFVKVEAGCGQVHGKMNLGLFRCLPHEFSRQQTDDSIHCCARRPNGTLSFDAPLNFRFLAEEVPAMQRLRHEHGHSRESYQWKPP